MPRGEAADEPPAARVEHPTAGRVEQVVLDTDEDVAVFVQRLLRLFESPRERAAIGSGQVRFSRRSPAAGPAPAAGLRVERGAVTERKVDEARAAGGRLVIGAGAVLTPLARDRARQLGVEIEKEARC